VLLAQLLGRRGLVAAPERILSGRALGTRHMPDVLVDFNGLRLAIEGDWDRGPAAQRQVADQARARVEKGIAHLGIAVLYPSSLRAMPFQRLEAALQRATLRFAVLSELPDAPQFAEGDLETLSAALRGAYEQISTDQAVERAVRVLEGGIDAFTRSVARHRGTTERFASILGIRRRTRPALTAAQRRAVNRIGALILVNAMIFQEVLAAGDRRVRPLQRFRNRADVVSAVADHWRFILDKINYLPIFNVAHQLLSDIAADADVAAGTCRLVETALTIVTWRAALRHDLAGRIYHRLLAEAKYLGAYYTAIPTAALLLKLALSPDRYSCDWSDLDSIANLRVADLACGTGTLLMAAADAVADNYFRACAEAATQPDPDAVHRTVVEHAIYGFDVLASALHLTASSLSLRVPDVPINVTNLFSMPLGGPVRWLGSLEFISSRTVTINTSLFGHTELPERVVGTAAAAKPGKVALPAMDLCVMNPPFVRSVGGNLLFGSLPPTERPGMQRKLQTMVREKHLSASITAGLGAVFVALAHPHIKPAGSLALILPRGLLSGVSWQRTRELIGRSYRLDYLVVSHEADHWNFSENTDLSEVLVLAQKRDAQPGSHERVVCVNLWQQPRSAIEALSVARSLAQGVAPDVATGQGALQIPIGSRKIGEAVSVPWSELRATHWGFPCAFAQSELLRALHHLTRGELYVPGRKGRPAIALRPLGELGELGFDRRDIHDGFDLAEARTAYPAFWGHAAADVSMMSQVPNRHLEPLASAKPRRNLRKAADLWAMAGRVLIAERLRLNTARLASVLASESVLSNVWWTFRFREGLVPVEQAEKALVLWLNSALGTLLLLGHREETEGPWVDFKKPTLAQMSVLDVAALDKERLGKLAQAYDRLATAGLDALPAINGDGTRRAIDDIVAEVLGLPDFGILRELLSREPIICITMDRLLGRPAAPA
jgi:hypothetical protein